jgi:hypothetical protein
LDVSTQMMPGAWNAQCSVVRHRELAEELAG